jgi:hypothetical protein
MKIFENVNNIFTNHKKWARDNDKNDCSVCFAMGGFHRAVTGKNKKVIQIFPLLAFWAERAKE